MRLMMAGGLVALAFGSNASAVELKLRCDGVASYTTAQSTFGSVSGDVDLSTSSTHYGVGQTRDRILVEINDAGGRIRPPKIMLPPLRGAGAGDGWWIFTKLEVGETEISAKFSINVLNKPSVRIDRSTGAIEVQGFKNTRFVGQCEVADPSERKF